MAKQVTEDDLKAGLKSVGNLGALGGSGTGGTRRDSPFGNDFVKRTAPVVQSVVAPSEVQPAVESRPAQSAPSQPVEQEPKPAESKLVSVPRTVKMLAEPRAKRVQPEPEGEGALNSDIFTERVTLPMSAHMRDELLDLARKLQRQRREKGERITVNTLMRVAITVLLDDLKLADSDRPSNEAELLASVRKKLGQ